MDVTGAREPTSQIAEAKITTSEMFAVRPDMGTEQSYHRVPVKEPVRQFMTKYSKWEDECITTMINDTWRRGLRIYEPQLRQSTTNLWELMWEWKGVLTQDVPAGTVERIPEW